MAEITIIPGSIKLIRLTDEEYFSSEYREYISNSRLGLINPDEGGSFEKFEQSTKKEYSDSFALGSAIHCSLLQTNEYKIANFTKPNGKLGLFAEELFKYRQRGLTIKDAIDKASEKANYYYGSLKGKKLKDAIISLLPFYIKRLHYIEDPGKKTIFLSGGVSDKYRECMKNIEATPDQILNQINPDGLFTKPEIFNEYAILCEVEHIDEDTGLITRIKLKAKLDNFIVFHDTQTIVLNDLKTTSSPISYFMGNNVRVISESGEESIQWYNGSFQKYHYYRQMGELRP